MLKNRVIGFSLVGGMVFVLGIAVLTLFVEVLKMDKVLAGFCSTAISVEVNFFANKYLNWADRPGKFLAQWWKFHVVRGFGIIVNFLIYTISIQIGIHYLVVPILGTLVVAVINYIGNDKFSFQ